MHDRARVGEVQIDTRPARRADHLDRLVAHDLDRILAVRAVDVHRNRLGI
jgi:hypothetical protein